jgi:polysaccharide pyruvyl transferase WcaK-like protein
MLIEIRGTGFSNKGAELMLHAVLQKVRDTIPDASLAMEPSGSQDYLKRAKLGLYQKVWFQRFGISLGRLISSERRVRYGLVLDDEVDVVLDASGFIYSDQWGDDPSLHMASCVKTWKQRGTKIILLPQAMGPFTSRAIRKAFTFVVQNSALVFPRDDISYKYVVELVGERDNVHQAPDFTNIVSGNRPNNPQRYQGSFCFIPNFHMIDKTPDRESKLYSSFCTTCIRFLIESGNKPFILIHGKQDLRFAEKIVSESESEIDIITESDALKIKGILGLCAGVIGSRYHGLVSSLSQGVPALATGWSHKYEMLFKEYGIPDGCLPLSIEPTALNEKIRRITDDDSRKKLIAIITKASMVHKEQTEAMWQKVFSVIEK